MIENKKPNSPKRSKVVVLVGVPAGVPDHVVEHLLLSQTITGIRSRDGLDVCSCNRYNANERIDPDAIFAEMHKRESSTKKETPPRTFSPRSKCKVVKVKARKDSRTEEPVDRKLISKVCPNCNHEVAFKWDVNNDGAIAFCPYCAHPIHFYNVCNEDSHQVH